MNRTQIYLTEKERAALRALSRKTGLTQSELIRQAVDQYLDRRRPAHRKRVLRAAKGLWRKRTDLPDFDALRREWNRVGL